MNKLGKLAVAAGAVITATIGVAPTAHAAGNTTYDQFSPSGYGFVRFYSYGEKFWVVDGNCRDHAAARVQYKVGQYGTVYSKEVQCTNTSDDVASSYFNESWVEDTVIYFRACDSGSLSGCAAWKKATA